MLDLALSETASLEAFDWLLVGSLSAACVARDQLTSPTGRCHEALVTVANLLVFNAVKVLDLFHAVSN